MALAEVVLQIYFPSSVLLQFFFFFIFLLCRSFYFPPLFISSLLTSSSSVSLHDNGRLSFSKTFSFLLLILLFLLLLLFFFFFICFCFLYLSQFNLTIVRPGGLKDQRHQLTRLHLWFHLFFSNKHQIIVIKPCQWRSPTITIHSHQTTLLFNI